MQTYHSIRHQTHKDWEWVLVPNGKEGAVPDKIREDRRVRVVTGAESLSNVGALKRFACDNAKGDAFIELDHDDLLMPGESLAVIDRHIKEGAGFVYSDAACFKNDNLRTQHYATGHGWAFYPVWVYGRKLDASQTFPVSPRSMCEVYYAPDHVRVWEREAYYKAGGHDPKMSVGDDHDLMCRTYLTGREFKYTGQCNYLYRFHQTNTYRARQAELQPQVAKNRIKYTSDLIREWCRRNGLTVAHVDDRFDWYDNHLPGVETGQKVGAIICDYLLQFCPPQQVMHFMNLCWDNLIPGGYLELRVPTTAGNAATLHHHAKSQHHPTSFLPYCDSRLKQHPQQRCRFQFIQSYDLYKDDFHKKYDLKYTTIQMAALKGQRHPGKQCI